MTARKPNLRAVTNEDAPRKNLTVEAAAATGNHRALLVAMRERIAKAVSSPDCPPRDLAALTRRLQDIAKEIGVLDARVEEESEDGRVAPDEKFDASAI